MTDSDLPMPAVRRTPDVQRMIAEIRTCTGWSKRQSAMIVAGSAKDPGHAAKAPLDSVKDPSRSARSRDRHGAGLLAALDVPVLLRRHVENAHALITRVFLLAGRDVETTARILRTVPAGGASPIDALRAGSYERAYIAAIDALRPRPTGLLVGSRPRRSGATTALHE